MSFTILSSDRLYLEPLLQSASLESLEKEFLSPQFNEIFPDARRLIGCWHGPGVHLEGDVAVHTALVLDNTRKVAPTLLQRGASFVELVAAILHDLKKPATRQVLADGSVSFAGHEAAAAHLVPHVAKELQLSPEETGRLHFAVLNHGKAHDWKVISDEEREALRASPFSDSLALLQHADALSCLLPGGRHLPVYSGVLLGQL